MYFALAMPVLCWDAVHLLGIKFCADMCNAQKSWCCSLAWCAGEDGLRVVISGQTGCVEEWEMGGKPLLAEGISPCFFRACIDNDRGGTGGRSYASRSACYQYIGC